MKKYTLKEVPAIVIKNSEFTVQAPTKDGDWDPTTHEIYKDYIGQKARSVQISDQKEIYKLAGGPEELENLWFGMSGKIVVTFEVDDGENY